MLVDGVLVNQKQPPFPSSSQSQSQRMMQLNGVAASHEHSLATWLQFRNPLKIKSPKPKLLKKPASSFLVIPKIECSASSSSSSSAKQRLISLISDQDRGLRTQKDPQRLKSIVEVINEMAEVGRDTITTGDSLSATWRLMWTTEKEQLFIIEKAGLLGTKAGDVLQVIDVEKGSLNNVITFPPDGVFFVRSTIQIASSQRVNFRFTSAVLRGSNWEIPLPPFGQGWFETVYLDDEIRVVKDIRDDYLVVDRAPYSWKE
ncbi:Probable plastid-lipid-associated protein 11, chloroplastic [Linum grandiflorum]